jgi:hypothetical protein
LIYVPPLPTEVTPVTAGCPVAAARTTGADMGRQADTGPAQAGHDSDLRELSDPEFFARWAEVRQRYAVTPKSSPGHPESKQDYDAAVAEYRRRMDGS